MNYLENKKLERAGNGITNFCQERITVCGLTMQHANFTRTNPSKKQEKKVNKRETVKDVTQSICHYVLFHDSTVIHLPDRAAYAALPA